MNRYTKIKDFHASRRKGVGSSDLPTLLGLNKRWGQTPLTLWREKTGRAEGFAGNERTEWGNYLEPLILRKFVTDRWGAEVGQEFYRNATRAEPVSYGNLKVKTEAFHPKYPFCLAHADLAWDPDATDRGEYPYLVEAKSTGYFAGKRREGQTAFEGYDPDDTSQQGIPDKVAVQVQWQLFCYGVQEAFVAVLIDTAEYRLYGPVVADPRVQEKLLALAERFWWHVENDREPEPTTWDDVVSLSPELVNETAVVTGEDELKVRTMIARSKDIKARIKSAEDELDDIKNAVGLLIGGNAVLASSDGETLAKAAERQRESLGLLGEVTKLKKKAELTPEEKELLSLDERLRALGLVKVSSWREVRY